MSGLVQQQLLQARVVKAFNNIYFEHLGSMQRPAGAYAEGGDFTKPRPAGHAELQELLDQADPSIR